MKHRLAIAALPLLVAVASTAARGQQESTKNNAYNWSGPVPQGRWIRIENINGSITFGAASGDKVEVTASEQWRHGDPALVHFDMHKNGDDVTICALWGEHATCGDHGKSNHDDEGVRNNDVVVNFKVLVPRGVKVGGGSVNGSIVLTGVTADIEASTVNGRVELTADGAPISASTVNGEILAHVSRAGAGDNMRFVTVNGNVVADLPTDLGADVELTTVNGTLKTDYEMTVSGRLDPRHLKAHVGKAGGPTIKMTTVNGNVELRHR